MRLSTRFSLLFDIDFLLSSVFDFLLQTPRGNPLSKQKRGSIKPTEQGILVQRDRLVWVVQKSQNGTRGDGYNHDAEFKIFRGTCERDFDEIAPLLDHSQRSAKRCRRRFPQRNADRNEVAANFANKHESSKIW